MMFKNLTTGEFTHNRAEAWNWYRKGHGDAIDIYRYNTKTHEWELVGGWVLL